MLEQENAFYDAHKAEFREKYLDKWLVISGESLWGVYDSTTDAVEASLGKLEPGKIMIHKPSNDGRVINLPRICANNSEGNKQLEVEREITYSNGDDLLMFTYPY